MISLGPYHCLFPEVPGMLCFLCSHFYFPSSAHNGVILSTMKNHYENQSSRTMSTALPKSGSILCVCHRYRNEVHKHAMSRVLQPESLTCQQSLGRFPPRIRVYRNAQVQEMLPTQASPRHAVEGRQTETGNHPTQVRTRFITRLMHQVQQGHTVSQHFFLC